MTERPILFNSPMSRAILDDKKTQTRRVVKWRDLQPGLNLGFSGLKVFSDVPNLFTLESQARNGWESRSSPTHCPMGQPGDRIYVRETWAEVARRQPLTDEDLPMRQDGRIVVYEADPHWHGTRQFLCADGCIRWARPDRWKPSIHMRKGDARIWLEITGVRVERLQQITEADCIAEGIEFFNNDRECGCKNYMDKTGKDWTLTAHQSFRSLWESTGGDWTANPYVWVIDFKPTPKEPA